MTGITHPNNAGIGHQASGIWDMGYGTWDLGSGTSSRGHAIRQAA